MPRGVGEAANALGTLEAASRAPKRWRALRTANDASERLAYQVENFASTFLMNFFRRSGFVRFMP